jgi:hypothetical protein
MGAKDEDTAGNAGSQLFSVGTSCHTSLCWENYRGGAHARTRTGDLILTKNVLCLLSYVGATRPE